MKARWIAFGMWLYACQPAAPSVEPNDLGITEVTVEHSHVQGERLLTVRGLDPDGAAIATATLRTGLVLYGADMPVELHPGTELAISVADTNSKFVSPDRVPHVIYEPQPRSLATFVALHAVARAIENEAGIQFAPPQRAGASDEIAFTTSTCSGSRFPINKGGANQCCQDDANTYHVNPATLAVANRSTYAPVYPSIPVCRDSAGNTGCTTNCTYGPCGSAVVSVKGTNGHVFVPTSNPNVCGWDDGGPGGLGADYSPEHYTSQTLWSGVTPTCGCTGCNADGTPQCGFLDDFNRSGTLGGSTWTIATGGFNLDGANAVATTTQNWARANPSPALGTNDYTITTRVSMPAGASHTSIASRGDSTANVYEAELSTQNIVNLWRRNNYNWTHLTSWPVTVNADTFYTLKLVTTGSNPVHVEVWVDGVQKLAYDDYSSGKIATGAAGMENKEVNTKYDFFQVDPTAPITPGPAPQSGSPFVDWFSRTNGMGATNDWSIKYGAFTTAGGYATSTMTPATGYGNWAHAIGDLGSANSAITAVMSVPAGSLNSGVFSRSPSVGDCASDNYAIKLSSAGTLKLFRRNGYIWTELAIYSTTITPGILYTVKLVTTGSNPVHLEAWLDGVQRLTYDDSSASRLTAAGTHGVFTYNDGVNFDMYRADAL